MKFIISSTSGDSDYWKDKKTTKESHSEFFYKTNGTIEKIETEYDCIEFETIEELISFCEECAKKHPGWVDLIINTYDYDIPMLEVYDTYRE